MGSRSDVSLYYQDDFVTLYHGDCLTEHREWLEADVLVTDPPYGIKWRAGRGSFLNIRAQTGRAPKEADHVSRIDGDMSIEARDVALGLWGDARPAMMFGSWREDMPKGTRSRLIWWKRGQAPGPTRTPFVTQDEEIYILGKGWPKADSPMRSVIPTDESRSRAPAEIGHPTPKPIGLMELLIDRCPAGTIADPFAGSGATLLAAKNLGRKSIGVELEEKYCEIIAKRCAQDVLDVFSPA
jgi:DNA modification methylase